MRYLKKSLPMICVFVVLLFTALISQKHGPTSHQTQQPISKTGFLLNTFVTITIYDSTDTQLLEECFDLCSKYEHMLSKTIPSSEVYQLNHRSQATGTFSISDPLAEILKKGLFYSQVSDGAFDITIDPVSSLWDFSANPPALPEPQALQQAVSQVGWEQLKLDHNQLTFLSENVSIDLGAIAKGYIADQLKAFLLEQNVTSAIINLGGNVLCIGNLPNGSPFRIGLQKPYAAYSETIGVLSISDISVVTSGVYERHFIMDGINYHHLLNPKTGYPYNNGLISVTILTPESVDGDALSTVCFSLGLEKGMELVNSMDHVYAYFITEDYQIHYSDGAESFLTESDV